MGEELKVEDSGVTRLELTPEQEKAVDKLSPKQRKLWDAMVKGWSAPAIRLEAIDTTIKRDQPAPAFHIPTAEGVATYRGLFGGNGPLSETDKEIARGLLQKVIGGPSDEDTSGNANGRVDTSE